MVAKEIEKLVKAPLGVRWMRREKLETRNEKRKEKEERSVRVIFRYLEKSRQGTVFRLEINLLQAQKHRLRNDLCLQ